MSRYLGILFLVLITALTGCASLQDNNSDPQKAICTQLKRQMVFNNRSPNIAADSFAPSQRQRLEERYEEYGCKEVLEK